MRALRNLPSRRAVIAGLGLAVAAPARAATAIRVAALKTGTFGWELDVIGSHGLDKAAGLTIEAIEMASPQAAELALRGGQSNISISDWLSAPHPRPRGKPPAPSPSSPPPG